MDSAYERPLRNTRRRQDRFGRRDPQRLPKAGQEAAPGPQSGRQAGGGAVQGGQCRQRAAFRPGEAAAFRRRRDRRLGGGEGASQRPLLSRLRHRGRPPLGGKFAFGSLCEGRRSVRELLRRSAEQARRRPGADLYYELPIDFLDAVNGATKTITLPQGGTLNVTIPPGVEDGQTLRLRGKGAPSPGEGPPGDALVQINVRPHRYFTREGADILLDLPISVKEAALGAEVRTPTTTGNVMLKIPKRANTGDVLRLRGKGVKTRGGAGDELVKLKVVMPTEAEPEFDAFLAAWKPAANYDPRKEM